MVGVVNVSLKPHTFPIKLTGLDGNGKDETNRARL